jgi:hypothetical protein
MPHLAKDQRDAPNFLHAALNKAAFAPFFKKRRMKLAEPTNLHRKSGVWGTHDVADGGKSQSYLGAAAAGSSSAELLAAAWACCRR